MQLPNDEMRRYHRDGMDPYNSPRVNGSTQGGLTALMIILVIVGGLIIYSSLSTPPAEAPPAGDAETPDSITGGGTNEIR